MNKNKKTRLLVIGLDGGTLDLLLPWAEDGRLPNFARLLRGGAHGTLLSTLPALTPPAWVSSYTGVNPGTHGIFDFFRIDSQQKLHLVNARDVKTPFFWQFMNQQGISTGLVNAPITYPPQPLDGFWVSGIGSPGVKSSFTYPESLRDKLVSRFDYKIRFDRLVMFYGTNRQRLRTFFDEADRRARASEHLLKTFRPDVFFHVFDHVDVLQHYFWKHMDETHPRHRRGPFKNAILNFLRAVDAHIGRFMEAAAPDANVVVYSDHGFGPLHYDVFTNKVLADAGMLTAKNAPAAIRKHTRHLMRRRANKVAYQLGLRPRKKSSKPPPVDNDAPHIDWTRTRAYFPSLPGQHIRLNLAGREPNGIVSPGREAEQTIRELKRIFEGLEDPRTGQKVVLKAYEPHEIYSGPHVPDAPDLILETNPIYLFAKGFRRKTFSNSIFKDMLDRSGYHRREGMVIISGPGVRSGARLPDSDIADIAPTLLHLAGASVPSHMQGRVIAAAFEKEPEVKLFDYDASREKGKADSTGVYTKEEEKAVKDHLRRLGYM
ncbi:MAG: alkaline phosphatase family protein [bacterium]